MPLGKFRYVAAAVLLPMVVHLIWVFTNTQIPVADADGPLMNSYRLYEHVINGEWRLFFKGLYTYRDWRPTGLYLVEFPFQLISGGNMLFTGSASSTVCLLVACIYLYRLLNLALPPSMAALGTSLLGLLPMSQWPGGFFASTEDALMASTLAAIYHLIRSQELTDKRHSLYFALASGLCFVFRPVETLSHMVPVFAVFLFMAWRKGRVSLLQLYLLLAEAMVALSLLVIMGWLQHGVTPNSDIFKLAERGALFARFGKVILIGTLLVLLAGAAYYAYRQWRDHNGFAKPYVVPVFSLIMGIAFLYYLGFVPQMVEWVFSTSLGNLAKDMGQASRRDTLYLFYMYAGALPFSALLVIGGFAFFFCITGEERRQLLRHKLLYLTAMVPLTLLLTLVSTQTYPRKVTIVVVSVLLLAMIPALMRGRLWALRVCLVVMLTAWQFGGMAWLSAGREPTPLLDNTIGHHQALPGMVTIRPNPHDSVADFMVESAKKHKYCLISMPILGNGGHLVDPFLLGMIIELRSKVEHCREGLHSPFPYYPEYNDQYLQHMVDTSGVDAMLVAPEKPLQKTQEEVAQYRVLMDATNSPTEKAAYELLIRHINGTLESSLGVKKSECRVIDPTGIEVCLYELPKKVK